MTHFGSRPQSASMNFLSLAPTCSAASFSPELSTACIDATDRLPPPRSCRLQHPEPRRCREALSQLCLPALVPHGPAWDCTRLGEIIRCSGTAGNSMFVPADPIAIPNDFAPGPIRSMSSRDQPWRRGRMWRRRSPCRSRATTWWWICSRASLRDSSGGQRRACAVPTIYHRPRVQMGRHVRFALLVPKCFEP